LGVLCEVFGLSLDEAKEIVVVTLGLANSLGDYQEAVLTDLEAGLSEDNHQAAS
jgi:hypothetical protein